MENEVTQLKTQLSDDDLDKAESKAEDNKSKDSSMENHLDQSQHRQCMSNDNDNNCTESLTNFNGLIDLETFYKTQGDLTKGTSRKYSENIMDENGKQWTTQSIQACDA